MKKLLYLAILLFTLYSYKTEAQYHIASYIWARDSTGIGIDTGCNQPYLKVMTNAYSAGLKVKTYYGNGTSNMTSVLNGGGYGYAYCASNISFPGSYTIKAILYNGTASVDSIIVSNEYLTCQTFIIKSFFDSAGTGMYDPAIDWSITVPMQVEVDSNGVAADTISALSGFYYKVNSPIGTVYGFKVIKVPVWLTVTSPSGGEIFDTLSALDTTVVNCNAKYFGFTCSSSTTGFDLAETNYIVAGIHDAGFWVTVTGNDLCSTVSGAVLTMNFSPKYVYRTGYPAPSSVSDNTIVWNIPAAHIPEKFLGVYDAIPGLTGADTIHCSIVVTPITGDINPANNSENILDTVSASGDPNGMAVAPNGNILAGTSLQYTIHFENDGNDTAFNISVYDTLSDNVNVKSLNIVMASAVMNITILNIDGHNIVKFDFPNINLLDSSHHGQCDGMLTFTVNAKDGLPDGTTIFNHAGIFFDYNPVVMTDTVENIIGFPTAVAAVSKPSNVAVYPNPANNEVTIQADNSSYNTATFTNVVGQQLMTAELSPTQTKVNVSKLPSGMYYITLSGAAGVKVMKFEKL